MLTKFFSKPMELTVGEQALRFCSIPDFEFALAGRTSVPSKKITELVKFSVKQLKNEAVTIKEIEKRFVAILSRSIEDPKSINQALREIDTTIFSQDHNWRNIIAALNDKEEDDLNPLRRVALVKYMQYLSARQDIIKYLYSEKQKYIEAVHEEHDEKGDKLKDTLVLESTLFEPTGKNGKDIGAGNMERMPKGEVVNVQLQPGKEIDIRLSRHMCRLSAKNGMEFIDQNGKHHPLKEGQIMIGRDAGSTIKLDSGLRDISRLHLMIDYAGDENLMLTDLSSHGTFLAPEVLEQHTA